MARPRRTGRPAPASAAREASVEAGWELFLAGYKAGDPDSKAEFNRLAGLNRRECRKLAAKARKLRNRPRASQ